MESSRNKGKQPAHVVPLPPPNQPPEDGPAMPAAEQNEPISTQYPHRWPNIPFILTQGPTELDNHLTMGTIDYTTMSTQIGEAERARLGLQALPSLFPRVIQTINGPRRCHSVVVGASISSCIMQIGRVNHTVTCHVVSEDEVNDRPVPFILGRSDFERLLHAETPFSQLCNNRLGGFRTMERDVDLIRSIRRSRPGSSITPSSFHVDTNTAAAQGFPNPHHLNTFIGRPESSMGIMDSHRGLRSQPQPQWQSPPSLREQHQMAASTGFAPEPPGAPDVAHMSSNDFSENSFGGSSEKFNGYSFNSTSLGAPGDLLEAMSWGAQGTTVPRNDFNLQYGAHQDSQPGPSGDFSDFLAGAGQGSQSQARRYPHSGSSGSQTSRDIIEQQPSMGLPKHQDHQFN